jgi:two-component system nitrogen regulation sensor histidine kinase NtrY
VSFRRKLLLVLALTVFLSVGAVTWIVSSVTRRAFERANQEQTAALVAQFRREFNRRGEEVAQRIETVAGSEAATRMALAVNRGSTDYGGFVNDAKVLAENQQLDFLEFVDGRGVILSSAQWPAKFGYTENSLPPAPPPKNAFLRQEGLPDGSALSLSAIRKVQVGDKPLFVIGGRRLDKDFIGSLELPAGMRAMLYRNLSREFSPSLLVGPAGEVPQPGQLVPLIEQVQRQRQEATELIHWSDNAAKPCMRFHSMGTTITCWAF